MIGGRRQVGRDEDRNVVPEVAVEDIDTRPEEMAAAAATDYEVGLESLSQYQLA